MLSNFQFIFLQDLGAPSSIKGLALTFTCIAEVPMFFVSTRILARFGVVQVLFSALLAYGIRFLLYSQLTNPTWTLPIELLHGFTYALGFAAATRYMHEVVPPGEWCNLVTLCCWYTCAESLVLVLARVCMSGCSCIGAHV